FCFAKVLFYFSANSAKPEPLQNKKPSIREGFDLGRGGKISLADLNSGLLLKINAFLLRKSSFLFFS
ncbi:MAG TPA: hypothetical protein PLY26_07630, partial [Ferruginibacter sp.]|nr:hypothetical protein [Ferruginibacter sp.]